MRRRRKTHYDVLVPDKWWCGKDIGWVEDLGAVKYRIASTHRQFKTANRARRHATAMPPGTTLLQWSFKRGKRRLKEYTRV